MAGKKEEIEKKIENIGRKKISVIAAVLLLAAIGVYFLAGPVAAVMQGDAINSQTLSFRANGTALNVSGNGTVNLGIATGEKLNFGRIPVDAKSTKYFQIDAREKALLIVNAEGNISQALEFEKIHYFEGNKEADIVFDPQTPDHFEGNVTVTINTAENEVGARWLDLKSKLY